MQPYRLDSTKYTGYLILIQAIMESASSQAATTAKRHYLIAILVSFGLSILFWIALGIFDFVGFLFWSCLAALLGSSVGLVLDRKIWISVVATVIIRLLILAISLLVT